MLAQEDERSSGTALEGAQCIRSEIEVLHRIESPCIPKGRRKTEQNWCGEEQEEGPEKPPSGAREAHRPGTHFSLFDSSQNVPCALDLARGNAGLAACGTTLGEDSTDFSLGAGLGFDLASLTFVVVTVGRASCSDLGSSLRFKPAPEVSTFCPTSRQSGTGCDRHQFRS